MPEPPAIDHQEDRRLIEAFLRSRSQADFRALYRRHTPALCGFAHRLAQRGRPDVDDVIQETWVRAISGLESFRGESNLRTWLRAIVYNVYREWLRRPASHDDQLSDEGPHLRVVPTQPTQFTSADLEAAVVELAPGYREVLILHDVEGYTHEEIARLTGIDTGTSKSQLSRARRAVRSRLSEEESHGSR